MAVAARPNRVPAAKEPAVVRAMPTAPGRFWKYVDRGDGSGCWLWTGWTDKDGYGRITLQSPVIAGAHRYSYFLATGVDPDELHVLHNCDTPQCVNPEHLSLGTPGDNSRDIVIRGRHPGANMTHCRRGHPFDESNTHWRKDGRGRQCRACDRINHRNETERRRAA